MTGKRLIVVLETSEGICAAARYKFYLMNDMVRYVSSEVTEGDHSAEE